ncbi:MAG: hypothetical protein V1727_01880 [Candidatus Omnitrophota bacterium]
MFNKKGTALILAYLAITVLMVLGAAFMIRSIAESRLAERQKKSVQAFAIAEAGLEVALYRLRLDFENDPAGPSFLDGDINGIVCGPDTLNFYQLLGVTVLGNDLYSGTYAVDLRNVAGATDEVWVRSRGIVGDITKVLEAYVKIKDESPWNNVIFGGTGASGALINGNVNIAGSVHLLGTGLADTDLAMDMGGGASVYNNYSAVPGALLPKIPACPSRMFNGEMVQSLGSEVRIRQGQAGLSGTSKIGSANVAANATKETADGVYVSDGYGGNQGANNVYSDNSAYNNYDLGDGVPFLSLSDSYDTYATYQDYLFDNALVINDPAQLTQLANIQPGSSFNYSSPEGAISMDGAGNLAISGIVYVDGGNLNFQKQGAAKTINYTGRGSLFTTGSVNITCSLYTQGNNSFPSNVMGVMTPNNISFSEANIDVMGLFYAENTITSTKQTDVVGAFIGNYFDMGSQVPSIFQVPSVIDNLPPGMINRDPVWVSNIVLWRKLN